MRRLSQAPISLTEKEKFLSSTRYLAAVALLGLVACDQPSYEFGVYGEDVLSKTPQFDVFGVNGEGRYEEGEVVSVECEVADDKLTIEQENCTSQYQSECEAQVPYARCTIPYESNFDTTAAVLTNENCELLSPVGSGGSNLVYDVRGKSDEGDLPLEESQIFVKFSCSDLDPVE